jgi:hypothetical protein
VIAGSDGSVITEGRCGNAPRDLDLVGVSVSVVVAGVVDEGLVSVVGGVVVAGVGLAVVAGGAVGVVVIADGAAPSWDSWSMPQTITPMRNAITAAQPTNAIGFRQVGTASMASDGIGAGHAPTAATHAATDQHSKLDLAETGQERPGGSVITVGTSGMVITDGIGGRWCRCVGCCWVGWRVGCWVGCCAGGSTALLVGGVSDDWVVAVVGGAVVVVVVVVGVVLVLGV